MPKLKLYYISQTDVGGWDTYDSAVVAAFSATDAAKMDPYDGSDITKAPRLRHWTTDPAKVQVIKLGKAAKTLTEPRVICASFNAG